MERNSKRAKLAGGESTAFQEAYTELLAAMKKLQQANRKLQDDQRRMNNDRQKLENDAQKVVEDRQKVVEDLQKVVEDRQKVVEDRQKVVEDRQKVEKDRQKVEKDRQKVEKDRQKVEKDRQKVEEDRKAAQAQIAPSLKILDILPVYRKRDSYNAVFYGENNEILGRTFVTDVNDLLTFAKVVYDWGCLDFGCEDGKVYCGPLNPIHIFKRMKDETLILLENWPEKSYQAMYITPETTGKDLVEHPYFHDKMLCYKEVSLARWKNKIVTLGIEERSKIKLVHRQVGGGYHSLLDIGGKQESGKGKLLTNYLEYWYGFCKGLNIIGFCEHLECPTRKSLQRPSVKLKFGCIRFSQAREGAYMCPKCFNYTLKPVNFLVAGAQTRFIFRESGQERVKYALLHSNGPFPNYVQLAMTNDMIPSHDSIQVTTCQLDESPFRCMLCAQMIDYQQSELKKPCGHYFHETCFSKTTGCPVCQAKLVSEKEMKAIMQSFQSS